MCACVHAVSMGRVSAWITLVTRHADKPDPSESNSDMPLLYRIGVPSQCSLPNAVVRRHETEPGELRSSS